MSSKALHSNISFDEYLMLTGISSTDIRNMLRTPAYYQYQKQHPRSTQALDFGSAVHTAILEPNRFEKEYVMMPLDGRSKEAKEFKSANADKTILSAQDYSSIQELILAVKNNPASQMLLYADYKQRWVESSIMWTDESTGLKCKCRPDLLIENGDEVYIVDLKTTVDASPEGFNKSITKYNYHIQAAHYLQGVKRVLPDKEGYAFYIVALEKAAPYQVGIYRLDDSYIDIGEKQVNKAFELFQECIGTGEYKGYSENPVVLAPPLWLIEKYI